MGRNYFISKNLYCDCLGDLEYSGVTRVQYEILVYSRMLKPPFHYQQNSSALLPSANFSVLTCLIFLPSKQGLLVLWWTTWVVPPPPPPICKVCVPRGILPCVLVVGQQERHVVGNLGCMSDHWKTLRKPLRGTNNFMGQHYRIHGEWKFSQRDLWKERKFVSE